jgi:hypothetical protein
LLRESWFMKEKIQGGLLNKKMADDINDPGGLLTKLVDSINDTGGLLTKLTDKINDFGVFGKTKLADEINVQGAGLLMN